MTCDTVMCDTVTGDVPQLFEESLMSRPEIGPDSVVGATCSLNRDVERSTQLTPGKHKALLTNHDNSSEISLIEKSWNLRGEVCDGVKCAGSVTNQSTSQQDILSSEGLSESCLLPTQCGNS